MENNKYQIIAWPNFITLLGVCWSAWMEGYHDVRHRDSQIRIPGRSIFSPHSSPVVSSVSQLIGKYDSDLKIIIFKFVIKKSCQRTLCEISSMRIPQNLTNEKLTLVQVMVWCRRAPSHYHHQCWTRSMSPYGIILSKWVEQLIWVLTTLLLCIIQRRVIVARVIAEPGHIANTR